MPFLQRQRLSSPTSGSRADWAWMALALLLLGASAFTPVGLQGAGYSAEAVAIDVPLDNSFAPDHSDQGLIASVSWQLLLLALTLYFISPLLVASYQRLLAYSSRAPPAF